MATATMNTRPSSLLLKLSKILLVLLLSLQVAGQTISTVAGTAPAGFAGDNGPAINARFENISGIALGPANTLYISDQRNNRIRKVDLVTGIVKTIAGTGAAGFTGDGGPATAARISSPGDIVADAAGNVYFADELNYRVRMISSSGIITTIMGGGVPVYTGQTTTAVNVAVFTPTALTLGRNNDLYVALTPSVYIVRLDLGTGIMQRYAGNGNNIFSGDGGPALNASFNNPQGLCMTANGDLFVADAGNNRVRKIAQDNTVSTVAGDGMAEFLGDGGDAVKASMYFPSGVAFDAAGNMFISDKYNHRIRRVDATTNVISTVAASGIKGFGGDGFDATSYCVNLADPSEIRFDASGNYYIADFSNSRVRMVSLIPATPPPAPKVTITASATQICPNARVDFTSTVTNMMGTVQYRWRIDGQNTSGDGPTFSTTELKNGQIVTCQVTTQSVCGGNATVTSNSILISISFAVTPSVKISTSTETICAGMPLTFTAAAVFPGNTPVYQWQVNGNNVGTNSTSFTSSNIADGDVVRCSMTTSGLCQGSVTVTSNTVTIKVNPVITPVIDVKTGSTTICTGSDIRFEAMVNTGALPVTYSWMINGVQAGSDSPVFNSNSLNDGDEISCALLLDPQTACVTLINVSSAPVKMTVINAPPANVSITSSGNNLCAGTQLRITATAQNAGTAPGYNWLINNQPVTGNNGNSLERTFNNGDEIKVKLTPGAGACGGASLESNIIAIRTTPLPVITIPSSEVYITPGAQAELKAATSADVTVFKWEPANLLSTPSVVSPLTVPLSQNTVFTLNAETAAGCRATGTIEVKIYSNLLMPTVFTPNGDGVNDLFRIPAGLGLTLNEFTIYNRWGGRVFTTRAGAAGWNGMTGAERAPAGIYVYIISGKQGQKEILLKGTVTLVR